MSMLKPILISTGDNDIVEAQSYYREEYDYEFCSAVCFEEYKTHFLTYNKKRLFSKEGSAFWV